MQSTNEELNTVNEELHSRNEELARVNSDLVNLLGSVDLPTVIVGNDSSIRRLHAGGRAALQSAPGDIGRVIHQINPNLICDDLPAMLDATIGGLDPQAREAQDASGRWYSLRARPYKGVDNRLDGAVLTAIDIDDAKRYERLIERSRDYFRTIVETVTQPLLVLDAHLRVRTANRSFCEAFGLEHRQLDGVPLFELGRGRWNIPELKAFSPLPPPTARYMLCA